VTHIRTARTATRTRRAAVAALATVAAVVAALVAATGPAGAAPRPVRLAVRTTPGAAMPSGAARVRSRDDPLARIGWTEIDVAPDRVNEVQSQLLVSGSATAIEEPQPVQALTTPNDPGYSLQWEHTLTGTRNAWDTTTGSSGTTIAILDTGVNPTVELGARLLVGRNILADDTVTIDDHGGTHGTQAALVAAASGNNTLGTAGVCWACLILPVKVLDSSGSGTTTQSAAGIVWAVDHGASVVSLSLGGGASTQTQHDAVDYALAHGVPVVAAAGNSGSTTRNYPAGFDGVIAVGGSDPGDVRYSFSNFGDWVTLTAPGCDIVSADGVTLQQFCGTSAATPYVAGAIGLRRATGRFPGESPAATRIALMDSAHRTGENGVSASGRLQTDAFIGGWSQTTPPDPGLPPTVTQARYTPVTPARILDTRTGNGAPQERLGPRQSLYLKVTGAGGVPLTGASAAVLNVTVTGSTAGSYLSVYPHGIAAPTASSLNFGPGATVPNLVTARLGADGYVVIYNASGFVDVIADVQGYYDIGDGAGSSGYTPITPSRILDTRTGNGAATQALGANSSLDLQVTGRGGVPGSGVSAVAVNVTAAGATAGSYLTVWPTGVGRPLASNLNFGAGRVVPNMVIVPVGTGGALSVYNAVGSTDVIGDVVGWFGASAASAFTPLTPTRAMDTRGGFALTGAVGAGQTVSLSLAGGAGLGVPVGVGGVVLNVTVTQPTAGSYLALWPSDVAQPLVSNLNYGPDLTIANMVVAKLSADGRVSIYNAVGATHVIVDVVGYLA
jgi:hypothetical protein